MPSSPKPSVPAGAPPVQVEPPTDVVELSFAELQARMASGKETAKSLVAKYRRRIEALDQNGPKLRAALELNPEADAIACSILGKTNLSEWANFRGSASLSGWSRTSYSTR